MTLPDQDFRTAQMTLDSQVKHSGSDTNSHTAHGPHDGQKLPGGVEQTSEPSMAVLIANVLPAAREQFNGSAAPIPDSPTNAVAALADPLLSFLAAVLDDLEDTRKANENRLRQLTRSEADSDGEMRGFGLDETDPNVAQLAALVDGLAKLEHDAVLNLQRRLRKHPLAAWCKAQKGMGEKQIARLLAAIGDPYWHTLEDRPRGLRELWAYCGFHNVLAVHRLRDDQHASGGGDSTLVGSGLNQMPCDSHHAAVYVAARRAKGQKSNWSNTAKMRAFLIAEAMLKAGNRELYDKRRALTAEKLHDAACAQCGVKSKPAQIGTPWRLGHQHADALRIMAKDGVLRPLWEQAKAIHLLSAPAGPTPDVPRPAGVPNPP